MLFVGQRMWNPSNFCKYLLQKASGRSGACPWIYLGYSVLCQNQWILLKTGSCDAYYDCIYFLLTHIILQGGLHQISWFQFLPHESDVNSLVDKRFAIWAVLSPSSLKELPMKHIWFYVFLNLFKGWSWIRKTLPHGFCSHHIYNCRRKDFSAHGPILLLDLGIHLRVFTTLV